MRRFDAKFRGGLTLIELLVVIGIIGTLAAVTIPVMLPAVEARRTREAARGVSAFLAGARARAIENGRPVGVVLHRMNNTNAASMALFYAEQPPPFAGYTTGATIQISGINTTAHTMTAKFGSGVGSGFTPGNIGAGVVHIGDLVRLNFQGHYYRVSKSPPPTTSQMTLEYPSSAYPPWQPGGTYYVPYQIFRQPQVSAASPYQLPAGTVVDLSASGIGTGQFADFSRNIALVFNSDGSVNSIYYPVGGVLTRQGVPSTIFLMIGKRENIGSAAAMPNWQDPTNLWVTIAPRSGQATVAEVAPPDGTPTVAESRVFARSRRVLGGQ